MADASIGEVVRRSEVTRTDLIGLVYIHSKSIGYLYQGQVTLKLSTGNILL